MTKLKMIPLALIGAAMLAAPASASVADAWPVPAKQPALTAYGAIMPYTRYDCNSANDATLSGGASLKVSRDWDAGNKATSASSQAYVDLPVGASVSWKATTEGDGVTIRYTIKDSHVGGAGNAGGYAEAEGNLDIYVNGQKAGSMGISSYYMYQYFSKGSGSPSQSGGDAQNFCFDERHVQLNQMVKPGDTIEVRCTKGSEVGVDFLELEVVPEELDPNDEANGRQVFTVTDYGAKADQPSFDNRDAFIKCFNAASNAGGIMFIPKGTWYMGHNGQGGHGMLSLYGKNVKVMGAGIWHTNIQFTGWEQFGGGISGGNPSNTGGHSEMDNIEWCHMYINSNLSDRHGENAVYKCFMDIWCNGSVIHDVWEQHFECGFWFGDYNNANKKSEVKVVNCRIRDNYADGVNFCRGTSNSAVFNCSIRNTGDDGLACWDDPALGSQVGNTFCRNTIDFTWRAGGIAVYGGKQQKVYNNYICDMFMASGIHCNDTFSRGSMEDIEISENVLVRCGTPWECWGRDYAAIDFEGGNTATVTNNYVYDSPAEAIRVIGNNGGVTIDGVYISGAALSGCSISYSASPHTSGVGNIQGNCTLKNIHIEEGTVHECTEGLQFFNGHWPWYGGDNTVPAEGSGYSWTPEDSETWCTYVPPYPTPHGIEVPDNIFDDMTGYNFVLTGLDWITNKGKHSMYDGDQVTFKIRVDYKGTEAIPADNRLNFQISVDGTNYTVSDKTAWEPNGHKIIEFTTPWTATKGEHTFTATLDTSNKLKHETNKSDNTRVKNVNVMEVPAGEEPEITIPTHSGTDMGVVKVYFEKADGSSMDEVNVGDKLIPHAIVANYGSQAVTLGAGQGVLWALGGTPEYQTGMLWDDQTHTVAPGEWIDVTPCGGGSGSGSTGFNSDYTYTVTAGTVDLYCRMDSPTKYNDDTTENNMLSQSYEFPKSLPTYNENPDKADNLNTGGYWDYEDGEQGGEDPVKPFFDTLTDYNFVLTGLDWTTDQGKHSMYAGDKVNFKIRVDYKGNTPIPADNRLTFQVSVDGTNFTVSDATAWSANSHKIITFSAPWTAKSGVHTFTAKLDTGNKLKNESNKNDNTRVKNVNVKEPTSGDDTNIDVPTHNGRDMGVVKVYFTKADGSSMDNVKVGDKLIPHAIVANYGSQTIHLGAGQGVLWALGGTPEYQTGMLWDDADHTIEPGQWIDVTPCGGGSASGSTGFNADWTYTVTAGTVALYCRMDNPDKYNDDNSANNMLSQSYEFPKTSTSYLEDPDKADNLDNGGFWDYEDEGGVDPVDPNAGFDLIPLGIFWEPGDDTINAGETLSSFGVYVKNDSNVALAAGTNVRVTLTIDGVTVGTANYVGGIDAMKGVEISIPVEGYTATAGGHTVKAVITGLTGELRTDNNSRVRTFNADGGSVVPQEPAHYAEFTKDQMGNNYPFWVKKVEWFKDGNESADINAGDKVRFRATIEKVGECNDANVIKGIRFEFPAGSEQLIWADQFKDATNIGDTFTVTTNGGNIDSKDGTWNAVEGDNNVGFWFDDQNRFGIGAGPRVSFLLKIGKDEADAPDYVELPTGSDNRDDVVSAVENIETETAAEDVWFTLQGVRVERPTAAGVYIHNGRKVIVK